MSAALKGSGAPLFVLLGCRSDRPEATSVAEVRVENGVTIVDNPGLHLGHARRRARARHSCCRSGAALQPLAWLNSTNVGEFPPYNPQFPYGTSLHEPRIFVPATSIEGGTK